MRDVPAPAKALVVDHLHCVRDHLYAKRVARRLYGFGEQRGAVVDVAIDHEPDDACCKP